MFRDSFRAGTITVTRGGLVGSRDDSASRDVERVMRSDATMGVSIHGIVAAIAAPVESFMIGMGESYPYSSRERMRGAPASARLS